jgi:hypothetical protein
MQQTSQWSNDSIYLTPVAANSQVRHASILLCNWHILRKQLLGQWTLLNSDELTEVGPDCRRISDLIARKYGIMPKVVENYLRNFERTLPLL